MKTLDANQSARLAELQAMSAKHQAAWQKHASHSKSGSSATPEQQALIRAECGFDFTNDQRAELETLLFLSTAAQAEFVYPSQSFATRLTGFMGNQLMTITAFGAPYRSPFGDTRRNIRAQGINGESYYGTIYGTYARMKPSKAKKKLALAASL